MVLEIGYEGDRVAVLLDLQNTERYMRINHPHDMMLDYEDLATELVDGRRLVGAYIFDSCPEGDPKGRLINNLRSRGFRAEIRRQGFEHNGEQKEVDVALATRMVALAYQDVCDVIILVSGDRDFVPAVEEVQRLGKKVEVASFVRAISNELRMTADRYVEIDKLNIIDVTRSLQRLEAEDEVFGDDEVIELTGLDDDSERGEA